MEVNPGEFTNDEWRDALVAVWPMSEPNEQGEANVRMQLRLLDPIDLLGDLVQYAQALANYYSALMGKGSPAANLTTAAEALGDAHWFLIDQDFEPGDHEPDIKPEDFS